MKTRLPKYITRDQGPDKKERFYFRRPGQKKIRIKGVPWTPAFMAAWGKAMGGDNVVAITAAPIEGKKTGTFNWLCDQYYDSAEFKQLDVELTQKPRKRIFSRIAREATKPNSKLLFGDVALAHWNKKAIRVIRDRFVDTPGTVNDMLKALRVLFEWALDADHAESNPARLVKLLKSKNPNGHHSWTIEEVEQYENKWPIGTQERLAMAMLIYSSQRMSDVILFGRDHIKLRPVVDDEGRPVLDEETCEPMLRKWIVLTQFKNRDSKPVHLEIPLRPELEEIIDATPGAWERKTFLTQKRGKPHRRMSFVQHFAGYCIEAGVPGRSHGLRKAAAVRLAEMGATDKEIMSITGHSTMQEVTRYTKAANQKKLAAAATEKMKPKKVVG